MASKNKYAPDISWEDVSSYVRDHTRSSGYQAVVLLVAGQGVGGGDYAEVRLYPLGTPTTGTPSIVTRGPFPSRQISRQMSIVLHLVAQAYNELTANPWLWSPERRLAARGE